MVNQEVVLYYNPTDSDKAVMVKRVLLCMGVRVKSISDEQVVQTIGHLTGLKGFEAVDTPAPPLPVISDEIMVMQNFTRPRMDALFHQLRKAGVPPIELKAVVTETNCVWPLYQLYEMIKEEHEYFKKMKAQKDASN